MNLKNKKIIVMGLARSGIASAKFLANQGASVTIIDEYKSVNDVKHDAEDLLKRGVKFKIGIPKLSDFYKVDLTVISPGIPHKTVILENISRNGIPVIGEIELASNFINKPIIAVTGTNGKTSTVKLIEKMLINSSKKVFLGGNIGVPLIECLDHLKQFEIIIAEISSFQLDTVKSFKPTTSVLLNIAVDHMNRYSNFNNYINSKLKIFSNQTAHDVAIFNISDKNTKRAIDSITLKGKQQPFSNTPISTGVHISKNSLIIYENKKPLCEFNLAKSSLKGNHNKENIAAASIAALTEGGNKKGIQTAIDNFDGLSHRIETIGTFSGIKFVNDSKATNVHATISAIKCFSTPIILILGGQSKNDDFTLLRPLLSQQHIKNIVVMGEARNDIKEALSYDYINSKLIMTERMEEAFERSIKIARAGYTVLLSPACSSFDQFKDYKHRGHKFKKLVKNLIYNIN